MRRILWMVIRNILFVPYWFLQLCLYGGEHDSHTEEERFALLKKITGAANRSGRVIIKSTGLEHIPKDDGFIMYPNHQGLYDVLAFVESSSRPFSVVAKKEVGNVIFLKQVFSIMRAKIIDREDIKQGLTVILEVAREVQEGRNYIIFAEGTRSKEGNMVQEFKGGSFKAAMKAKCPIVPVAIIDAYKPFDTHSIKPVTVQIHYLPAIYYEDYKNLKSTEIARMVKDKIQETINKNI